MVLMQTFKEIWSDDQKSNQFKLMMEGTLKGKTMAKSALTQWDWEIIAQQVSPLQSDPIKLTFKF